MRLCAMRSLALAGAMLASLAGPSTATAQSNPAVPDYATGLEWSSAEDIAGIPVAQLQRAYIPEAISLMDRMPEPGNQNPYGSCAAWATAYAARSYYNASFSAPATRPAASQIASPAYLYNVLYSVEGKRRTPQCDNAGADLVHALRALRLFGVPSHQDYDYSKVCKEEIAVPSPMAQNRILDYETISWDPPQTSKQYVPGKSIPLELDKVRQRLAGGHPVVFGMQIGDSFKALPAGAIYRDTPQAKPGGHAMVLIGYDDRRRAFHVLNSWGRTWADSGYAWIGYESFLANVREAFVMKVAGVTPPRPVPTRPATEPPRPPEVADMPCAGVYTERREGSGLRFAGFVADYDQRRALDLVALKNLDAVAAGKKIESPVVENAVAVRPWPVCEAMLTLREPMLARSRPQVSVAGSRPAKDAAGGRWLAGDAVALKVGDTFSIGVTAPDVPTFLYAFYIEDDGNVVNLTPRRGPIRKQVKPGEQIVIGGGPQQGQPTFTATKPKGRLDPGDPMRGHESVVVIAARAPIQELEDRETPKDAEKPGTPYYKVAAKSGQGPADRLFLSLLRNITLQRAEPNLLPREVSAAVVHIKIEE
jgi:papain like protease